MQYRQFITINAFASNIMSSLSVSWSILAILNLWHIHHLGIQPGFSWLQIHQPRGSDSRPYHEMKISSLRCFLSSLFIIRAWIGRTDSHFNILSLAMDLSVNPCLGVPHKNIVRINTRHYRSNPFTIDTCCSLRTASKHVSANVFGGRCG